MLGPQQTTGTGEGTGIAVAARSRRCGTRAGGPRRGRANWEEPRKPAGPAQAVSPCLRDEKGAVARTGLQMGLREKEAGEKTAGTMKRRSEADWLRRRQERTGPSHRCAHCSVQTRRTGDVSAHRRSPRSSRRGKARGDVHVSSKQDRACLPETGTRPAPCADALRRHSSSSLKMTSHAVTGTLQRRNWATGSLPKAPDQPSDRAGIQTSTDS